jgi:hypothetical protein
MSTLNGYANPEGDVAIPDGGMSGINLYAANSAPVVTLPMGDYMADAPGLGQAAPSAPAAPAAAPSSDFSISASAMKPRVLIPAAVGAVIGWCLAGSEDYTERAKNAGALAAGVGLAAIVGDWLSSK